MTLLNLVEQIIEQDEQEQRLLDLLILIMVIITLASFTLVVLSMIGR